MLPLLAALAAGGFVVRGLAVCDISGRGNRVDARAPADAAYEHDAARTALAIVALGFAFGDIGIDSDDAHRSGLPIAAAAELHVVLVLAVGLPSTLARSGVDLLWNWCGAGARGSVESENASHGSKHHQPANRCEDYDGFAGRAACAGRAESAAVLTGGSAPGCRRVHVRARLALTASKILLCHDSKPPPGSIGRLTA